MGLALTCYRPKGKMDESGFHIFIQLVCLLHDNPSALFSSLPDAD